MKLTEVVIPKKPAVDWNLRSEKDQIAMIKRLGMYGPDAIRKIDNPSPTVQLFAVNKNPLAIFGITNPTPEAVNAVLPNEDFINCPGDFYNKFVKRHFKNNTVLMNKWLRYAENIKELNQ
jgi:hypothetical protein